MHIAKSPDEEYQFWIANGFLLFTDYEGQQKLLKAVNIFRRYQVWRALKKEIKLRCKNVLYEN